MKRNRMDKNFTLYNGDCLEEMKKIPDGSVDMILTDPPYGTTACKWDTVIDLDLMWVQLKRIIKPNGAIVLFGSEPFSSKLRMSNLEMYRYDWIYRKPQGVDPLLVNIRPLNDIENIIVFYSKLTTYNPQMQNGKPYYLLRDKSQRIIEVQNFKTIQTETINLGTRYPKRVLDFKHDRGKLHPTQKPVKLLEYLVKTYTNENETVLDFTMGSGSTGVACSITDRKFIGIEMDKEYFKIAEDRIKDTNHNLKGLIEWN